MFDLDGMRKVGKRIANEIIAVYEEGMDDLQENPEFIHHIHTMQIRVSRSAWLLSKGTRKSFIKRQTAALYSSSQPIKFNTLPFFFRPRFLSVVSGRGFSAYAVFMISSYCLSNRSNCSMLTKSMPQAMAVFLGPFSWTKEVP